MKQNEYPIALKILKTMMLIRMFEERVKKLYINKKIEGAVHLCIGQEAIAAGVCAVLNDSDLVFSTHRGHGHALAKTNDVKGILAELYGKQCGVSHGHGGSMHLYDPDKGLMGGNGIVGGGIPLALGGAFFIDYYKKDSVSVCFMSDGAINQGTFGESLNLAALWKLPLLIIVENNHYAATTRVECINAELDISKRIQGYGVSSLNIDGNDGMVVYKAAVNAVESIRKGGGPVCLVCETYRIEPHCGIIPDEREDGEREYWGSKDPIEKLKNILIDEKELMLDDLITIEKGIEERLNEAVQYAKKADWPDPNDIVHMYWEK